MENIKNNELIKENILDKKNTGTTEFQIINLTKKISELTLHLKFQRKDITAKRSLLKLVARRKRFLKYFQKKNILKYNEFLKKISLKDN